MKTPATLLLLLFLAPLTGRSPAAELSTATPEVITVPAPDPVMTQPAPEVLLDMSRRQMAPLLSTANQEATTDRLKATDAPRSVEESGGALRKLERDRSWKAVYALFDPRAPLPPAHRQLAHPLDTRKSIDSASPASLRNTGTLPTPHNHRDPISHEPSLRLW
jgi:hypothetical protein